MLKETITVGHITCGHNAYWFLEHPLGKIFKRKYELHSVYHITEWLGPLTRSDIAHTVQVSSDHIMYRGVKSPYVLVGEMPVFDFQGDLSHYRINQEGFLAYKDLMDEVPEEKRKEFGFNTLVQYIKKLDHREEKDWKTFKEELLSLLN